MRNQLRILIYRFLSEGKMEQFGVLTLGSRLKRLSDHLFTQVQDLYSQCDIPITSTYFPVLRLLQKVGELSVMEIADSLHLSHPAVSKQTTKMLKEGLLEKKIDERDQRRSSLRLSKKGVEAMIKVEPVLKEMKVVVEKMTDFSSDNFMKGLEQFEKHAFDGRVANKILDRLTPFQIIPFEPCHGEAFYDLNMMWLKHYFPNRITDYDLALLSNPQDYIIGKNGIVWVAVRKTNGQDSVLGTIALMVHSDVNSGEVLKLSVANHCQGKGIAQTLLSHVMEYAESVGVNTLTLETASCLTTARHLYDKNGFVEMPPPKPSLYERADVYMEKSLEKELRVIT